MGEYAGLQVFIYFLVQMYDVSSLKMFKVSLKFYQQLEPVSYGLLKIGLCLL